VRRSGIPGIIGSTGWDRSRAGLDLGLLVHAQDDRLLRRIVVQADNIDDLLHEQRVGAQLEPVDEVRRDRAADQAVR
jgi:hypothetical protein